MARKKFENEEARKEKALEIAEYIIQENKKGNKISTRGLAKKYGLSNYTISVLMGDYLKKNFPGLYNIVHKILQGNIPKTIEHIDIERRVLKVAKYTLQGMTTQQIADLLGESINVINEDLEMRLEKINKEAYNQVILIRSHHSISNLNKGNPNFKEQSRDEKGQFKR